MHRLIYATHSVSSTYDLRRINGFLRKGCRRACAAVLAGGMLLAGCQGNRYVQFGGSAQGGTWSVKANLQGVKEKPKDIQRHIEAILYEIDTTLSGYNKSSQLSRFNAGETIQPSPMFLEVTEAAVRFWKETGGAVDCAAGPLFDIWGFGFKTDSLPSDDLVRQTMAHCGMARLVCSENTSFSGTDDDSRATAARFRTTCHPRPGGGALHGGGRRNGTAAPGNTTTRATLNFNAIAQGYSCDKVAEYLYSIGVKDMLVDIGEIFCDGLNPKVEPWRIGIDRPKDGNNTPGAELDGIWESDGAPHGVVTSGNYRKFYIKDGVKYSHTIDPRTGYPVQHNLLSATVIAPTALDADAYATYCMVIGFEAARDFILSRDDLEGCLIYGADHVWTSPGFKKSKR